MAKMYAGMTELHSDETVEEKSSLYDNRIKFKT